MGIQNLVISGPQPPSSTTGRNTNIIEEWICIMDGQSTPAAVLALLRDGGGASYGFPDINEGTQNPDDTTVKAVNLAVRRIENALDQSKFIAAVTYSNNSTTLSNSNNPLEAQPQISADFVDRFVVVEKDTVDDNVIANVVGTPIIVEENRPIQKVTVVRNEDDYRLSEASQHAGKLNSKSVTILGDTFPAYHCLLQRWSGTSQYDANGNLYWSVTYEILINDESFSKKFIERGNIDVNGLAPPFTVSDSNGAKLNSEGEFYNKDEQQDPTTLLESPEFITIEVSDWGRALRLQDSPANDINELSGGS